LVGLQVALFNRESAVGVSKNWSTTESSAQNNQQMQSVQDVSNGRFNIASINVKRNIPVFLKRTAVLWPIAAAYFYWSWNRVFDSSRQYRCVFNMIFTLLAVCVLSIF
jgi:hypothetical protein